MYDFCDLSQAVKLHLSKENVMFFESDLREKWAGTTKELESEVKQMIEVLKHSENDIMRTVDKQAAIVSYLHEEYMYVRMTIVFTLRCVHLRVSA